jgi:flagellar hook protein FlgE
MASTTAMFTALSGLSANSRWLDVTGNNVANVNTTSFKASRMLFSNAFSRTLAGATPPGANTGGTNPRQIGFGVQIAGVQRDFTGGAISPTGDARDLAIEGNGFFVVERGGETFYTRAGGFRTNADNELVNVAGERLQGYGINESFQVIPGALEDLTIPIGSLTLAEATRNVRFTGNLNAAGDVPTQGSLISLDALTRIGGAVAGIALEAATLLTDIADPAAPAAPLFADGQSIELSGATKGSKTIERAAFDIDATSTVQDFMNFLTAALGINTTSGANPDGRTPGVSLDEASGVISIVGNTGTLADLEIESADIRMLDSSGAIIRQPFSPAKQVEADGESVRTTFSVFDSRGNPLTMDLTFVLESNSDTGSRWRWFAESADDSDLDLVLGTGTLDFDVFGQPIGTTTGEVELNRSTAGALDPLRFTLDFNRQPDGITSLADVSSAIASTFQDGSPIGTLTAYAIGEDGIITGAFTNGLTRTLGQVGLATFANSEGLIDRGGNLYSPSANSGNATVTTPLQLSAGRIVPGALELSNVDLSQEFINLILASTGYSASSRVITTTEQLMQQLLVLGR